MTKLFVLVAALFSLVASEALAGDAPTVEFSQPTQGAGQDQTWTGFYGGVNGGYSGSNTNVTTQSTEPGTNVTGHPDTVRR